MELSAEEGQIVALVADFVDKDVRPVVRDLEHSNTYPEALIEQMKQMGVYGLAIPEPYGDSGVSTLCYSQVVTITGRSKDVIIRNMENISAREVENHALRFAPAAEFAAIGRPTTTPASGSWLWWCVSTRQPSRPSPSSATICAQRASTRASCPYNSSSSPSCPATLWAK